jgi:hypothetical protein
MSALHFHQMKLFAAAPAVREMSSKNQSVFQDQTSSSRVARIKANALQSYKLSQPKSGPVKDEKEVNSRTHALTRVRAGGYMVPLKVTTKQRVSFQEVVELG